MDWTELLNWIFGGTSLIGGVIWRKSKRKEEADTQIKDSEAKTSNIDAQKQEIDLVAHFKNEHDCIGLIKGCFWCDNAKSTHYTYCGNPITIGCIATQKHNIGMNNHAICLHYTISKKY